VAGAPHVVDQIQKIRANVICSKHERAKIFSDVTEMRTRLAQSKSKNTTLWEVKEIPGGLLDIELLAQACALICNIMENNPKGQLSLAVDHGLLTAEDAKHLIDTHNLLSQVQHTGRLLVTGAFDIEVLGKASLSHILTATGFTDRVTLEAALRSKTGDAQEIIMKYLSNV